MVRSTSTMRGGLRNAGTTSWRARAASPSARAAWANRNDVALGAGAVVAVRCATVGGISHIIPRGCDIDAVTTGSVDL